MYCFFGIGRTNMNLTTVLEDMIDFRNDTPTPDTCLVTRHNQTLFTISTYEGIPETLILNLIAWVFFILLFTVLRQQAWDYGRLVN